MHVRHVLQRLPRLDRRLLTDWGLPTLFWGAYAVLAARRVERPRPDSAHTAQVSISTTVRASTVMCVPDAADHTHLAATDVMHTSRERLLLQVDGTPGYPPGGVAGIGVVVRSARGHVLRTRCFRAAAATNNEAEYQAVITGLTFMLRAYPGRAVCCMSDSRVVIDQLSGRAAVRGSLQPLYAQARALTERYADLELVAIPRELNQLADALAWEALGGRGRILRFRAPPATPDFPQG